MSEPHRAPAGTLSRERGRQRVADDVDPVGPVVDPQGEPQIGVRPDVVVHNPGRPLRRQHEVHPEAATALGDPDERRQETRNVLRHRRKLVDHDHEAGERRAITGPVLAEVGGASRSEESLATRQFRVETHQGALGEAAVEVGHHPDGVRQGAAPVERGAALVVDQHELQMGGRHAGGEADDHRAQQLALPGPRRPGDQRVRTVPIEIEFDDTIGRRPDDDGEAWVIAAGLPRLDDPVDAAPEHLGMQCAERERCGSPSDRLGHVLGVGETGERERDAAGRPVRGGRR